MATSEDISPESTKAQLAEVKHRIAEVEAGEVELIPGDGVFAQVRRLLDSRLADMEANPEDQSPWPEVKARLKRLDKDEVVEALRRDAEIESDRTQAITLDQLDTQIQNRRK